MAGEMLEFRHRGIGIALNLEEESVGAVLLGNFHEIKEGDTIKRTGRIISVPVGEELLGRVVDALGKPIDGKGPIATTNFSPIERIAPGVVDRSPVKEPLQTGLKAIDAMHARDPIADRDDGADFGDVHIDGEAAYLVANDLGDFFGFDIHVCGVCVVYGGLTPTVV